MEKSKTDQDKSNGEAGSGENVSQKAPVLVKNGNDAISSRSVECLFGQLVIDPVVLHCSLCSKFLGSLVFQCMYGHILGFCCYLKHRNKCPSCDTQTQYIRCHPMEKVLKSVKMTCENIAYGCKEMIPFSDKHVHEEMCNYSPCSCPLDTCDFIGCSTDLVKHCRSHCLSAFEFDTRKLVLLRHSEKYKFYQEKNEGTIFIICNKSHPNGNALQVSCIGSLSLKEGYSFDMVARIGTGSRLRLQSTTKIVQGLSNDEPNDLIVSLVVPRLMISIPSLRLNVLELTIWKDRKQHDV